jgi:hypothetical protein
MRRRPAASGTGEVVMQARGAGVGLSGREVGVYRGRGGASLLARLGDGDGRSIEGGIVALLGVYSSMEARPNGRQRRVGCGRRGG